MGKVTFVVEFEDGSAPIVNGGTEILGGSLCAVSWSDYRDDYFTPWQRNILVDLIDHDEMEGYLDEGDAEAIRDKVELMTS
ncbi:TPA: hypothetical protein ACXGFD_002845 [Enterobacter cloacae]